MGLVHPARSFLPSPRFISINLSLDLLLQFLLFFELLFA